MDADGHGSGGGVGDRAGADLVLVTGPSGAGRSTAIHALEDAGFEAIDNMPLSLVSRLLDGGPTGPVALGVDVRNRDFSVDGALALMDALRRDPMRSVRTLYLDCAPATLVARFSETRRRHPLTPGGDIETGVLRERALLAPLMDRADILIDTTALTVHDLKREVLRHLGGDGGGLSLTVQSFSYKRGMPRGLDMAFDVRFLRNPHWVDALRPLTGRDPSVAAHIATDSGFAPFYDRVRDLVVETLPAYRREGRAHLAIGFGCTGGRHRSVCIAEMLARDLAAAGWRVSIRHRELDREGAARSGRSSASDGAGALGLAGGAE